MVERKAVVAGEHPRRADRQRIERLRLGRAAPRARRQPHIEAAEGDWPSASRSAASTSGSPPVPASSRPSPSRSIRCRSARPAMLTGDDGLPLDRPPAGYPLALPGDGILVDDPGHPRDLTAAVRAVFDTVFGASADAVWQEAAALLDPKGHDLAPGCARASSSHHLQRHSKSRRKAPILWQLGLRQAGTASGSTPTGSPATACSPSQRTSSRPSSRSRSGGSRACVQEAGPNPDREGAGRDRRPGRRRRRARASSPTRSAGSPRSGTPTSTTASCSSRPPSGASSRTSPGRRSSRAAGTTSPPASTTGRTSRCTSGPSGSCPSAPPTAASPSPTASRTSSGPRVPTASGPSAPGPPDRSRTLVAERTSARGQGRPR